MMPRDHDSGNISQDMILLNKEAKKGVMISDVDLMMSLLMRSVATALPHLSAFMPEIISSSSNFAIIGDGSLVLADSIGHGSGSGSGSTELKIVQFLESIQVLQNKTRHLKLMHTY